MLSPEILLIAGPDDRGDDELAAAAAAHHPWRVTVLIEAPDPDWSWSDGPVARARRDRLARLLTAVERATAASVVGLVGDPAELRLDGFDAIVDGQPLPAAA